MANYLYFICTECSTTESSGRCLVAREKLFKKILVFMQVF
jgi:hypothetical protein